MEKVILACLAILLVLAVLVFTSRRRIAHIYKKYLTVGNSKNITGLQLATIAKEKLELDHLNYALTEKDLGDAYVAKTKTLILSNGVANFSSLTSLAVVAHELGHAIQDRQNNRLFGLIQIFSKLTRFFNRFVMPLLLVGLTLFALGYFHIIDATWYSLGVTLTYISFVLIFFQIVVKFATIPLEYDASKKALWFLKDYGFVTKTELRHAKKLLNVAALTYIASLFDGFIVVGNKLLHLVSKKK